MVLGLAGAILITGCTSTGSALLSSPPVLEPVLNEAGVARSNETKGETLAARSSGVRTDLLDTLLANGAVTPEQHRELSSTAVGVASSAALSAVEDVPTVSMGSGGLRVTSADGESSMKIGGRVQVDGNVHSNEGILDPEITDGTELRRARFELKGTLPKDIFWAAELEFANNLAGIRDFWLGWHEGDGPAVTFGNQKQPFSLDVEMSSNDIPFVERGVDNYLIIPFVDRAVGARVQNHTDTLFWAAGVYGDGVTPADVAPGVDDEGWGATGRFVAAPIHTDDEVLHAGIRGSFRRPEDAIRIRDETTNMSNFRVVDTGDLLGVDTVTLGGFEAGYVKGPFSAGAEWNVANVEMPGPDPNFTSYHVQAAYTLTGESRAKAYRIDAGEFKRLRGDTPAEQPWEVCARYATIDLNSASISGGEEDVLSLGMNWYYSRNVRLMFNWSHILDTSGGSADTAAADGLNVFTFRAQLTF